MIAHALRLGCQPEGRIRRHNYTGGRNYDDLLFGLTREEFDALEERLAAGARTPISSEKSEFLTTINTPRLTIRRFGPEDADDLYEYLSDPQVYHFEPGEAIDRAQAVQRVTDMAGSPDFWAVELQRTGKVVGQLYLKQIERVCSGRTSSSAATPPTSRGGPTPTCMPCWRTKERSVDKS